MRFCDNQDLISEAQSCRPTVEAAEAEESPVTMVPPSSRRQNREDAGRKLETKRRCVGRAAAERS